MATISGLPETREPDRSAIAELLIEIGTLKYNRDAKRSSEYEAEHDLRCVESRPLALKGIGSLPKFG